MKEYTEEQIKEIKAEAVTNFIEYIIPGVLGGLSNRPTIYELWQVSRHHIADTYGADIPTLDEKHGKDIAEACGMGES